MNLNLEKFFSKSILMAGFIATASAGPVYDSVAGFSNAGNPNGVWSYFYSSSSTGTGGTAFVDTAAFNTQPAWVATVGGSAQFSQSIIGNQLGSSVNAGAIVLPADTLNLNPYGTNVEVVFTAPAAGSYTIGGTFLDDDLNVVTHPVDIFDNGTTIFSSTISTSQTSDPFSLSRSLSQNETITFFVTIGGSTSTLIGDFNTGLQATITETASSVPEPGTIVLLGAGLAGVAMLAWRRRQRRSAR